MAQENYKEKLSAYMDGELDAAASEGVRTALKDDPRLQKDMADFRRLASEAAKLPVPQMDEDTGNALWEIVADQTVKAKRSAETEARAASVSTGKWIEHAKALGEPPEVGEERWNNVWAGVRQQSGLQDRMQEQEREAEEAASSEQSSVSAQPLQADFTPTDLQTVAIPGSGSGHEPQRVQSTFSIWTAAGLMAVAALLLLAVLGGLEHTPLNKPGGEKVAEDNEFKEPEAGEHYFALVKHYPGDDEPAVCFFLKDDE